MFYTPELLALRTLDGRTPVHEAANTEAILCLAARGMLTVPMLTTPDSKGVIPAHNAAILGYLHQLPRELLNPEVLLWHSREHRYVDMPIHQAAIGGHLGELAKTGAVTVEMLFCPSDEGGTPLDLAKAKAPESLAGIPGELLQAVIWHDAADALAVEIARSVLEANAQSISR